MSEQYDGKVVWITGGGTGIGRALAHEYADRGADVAVSGRRLHKLEESVEGIERRGGRGEPIPCDVTEEEEVEGAVEEVVSRLGRLDVSVANAGYAVSGSVEDLEAEDWRRQLDVNVVGVAITARHSLSELRATDGRVALMGSVAGTVAMPDEPAYCASKFAVRAIGQSLSMELADTGVSCTTIQPGFVDSEIYKRDKDDQVHEDWDDPRPQQLMWPANKAARKIADAVHKRKREYTFTGHGRLAAFLGKHAPGLVHHAVTSFGE